MLFLPLSPVDERAQDKHNVLRVDVLDYGSAVSEKGEEVSACILSRSRFVAVSIAISRRRSRDPAYTRRNCSRLCRDETLARSNLRAATQGEFCQTIKKINTPSAAKNQKVASSRLKRSAEIRVVPPLVVRGGANSLMLTHGFALLFGTV